LFGGLQQYRWFCGFVVAVVAAPFAVVAQKVAVVTVVAVVRWLLWLLVMVAYGCCGCAPVKVTSSALSVEIILHVSFSLSLLAF
jgi:hypothetical protein